MISLVPDWARHYDAFWLAIRKRNLWLIKLRYGAVMMLLALVLSGIYLLNFSFTNFQLTSLLIINASILGYNLILHKVREYLKCESDKFNPLHFSLLQMLLDLTALMLLVYITGTIETPLYMLFIFHMIIGSLILPEKVIYSIAALTVFVFSFLAFGEYFKIIPHHGIRGLLNAPIYNDINYVFAFNVVFIFAMIISVFLANKIAHQLYTIEQELVESLNRLNSAEKEKQKYIMSVVHEIKTPISALHSYIDLILQKYLGPLNTNVEDKLKRALVRSDEAIQLINNVLKISRLRLEEELQKEQVDIKELICSIIKKQQININSKGIELLLENNRIQHSIFYGDRFLLEIAFSNLIGNAIKYVDTKGKIVISIFEAKRFIEIHISDNGIGIPAKDLENIFKDFYRASNIKKEIHEGTGLGLSFVKQIITKHGGNINVESPSELKNDKNPGCTFKVVLPL